jgi:RNAse (barnase) inhibitor barstar
MNEELIKKIEDKIKQSRYYSPFEWVLTELKKQNKKSCENCQLDAGKDESCANVRVSVTKAGIETHHEISYCSNYKEAFEKKLDRLSDELIENIINTPDSEILKEVEEDYGNSDYEANKFLEILEKAKNKINNKEVK